MSVSDEICHSATCQLDFNSLVIGLMRVQETLCAVHNHLCKSLASNPHFKTGSVVPRHYSLKEANCDRLPIAIAFETSLNPP